MKDLTPIYLAAANHIGTLTAGQTNSNYSCNAIATIEGTLLDTYPYHGEANRLYRKTMGFKGEYAVVLVDEAAGGGENSSRGRNFRRLLLCMAAACWRDMLPLMEGK